MSTESRIRRWSRGSGVAAIWIVASTAACLSGGPSSPSSVETAEDGGGEQGVVSSDAVGGARAESGDVGETRVTSPQRASGIDTLVRIRSDGRSSWRVLETIFGRFQEHNGRDVYPGLYAQHLVNGSFEDWRDGRRTEELYRNEPTFQHIAYPWRPKVLSDPGAPQEGKPSWRRPEGGVNGKTFGPRYQRIVNESTDYRGGVRQRIALPDRRTRRYVVRFHVRGETDGRLRLRLEKPNHGRVYAETSVEVDSTWQWHRKELTLEQTNSSRYEGTFGGPKKPWGEYQFSVVLDGTGHADVDMVMLISGDAKRGKYNPVTLRHLERMGVTSMRWPGGNIASAYRWKDGIGELYERPVKPNYAWGGMEPNYMGTDEYLEFSELADLEPFINIGFNEKISPQEAAEWVEYTNGSRRTPMGRKRADHGHPEPYDVKTWQVGNETYGSYQIGHTNAEDFAKRIKGYVRAMKEVDPSITVIAAGVDPYYFDYGGNHWNEVLLRRAGDVIDAIDIHRYVNGFKKASKRKGLDPVEYNQMLVAFPTQFEEIIGVLRDSAERHGHPDMKINVGEWNLQPHVDRGWPRAGYPTMAHGSFVAGMYNTFIRQGDAVRWAYQRDNTLYHRPYPIDTRPIGPNNYVTRLYEYPYNKPTSYRRLQLDVSGETFKLEKVSPRMKPQENVPFVDAAGLVSEDGAYRYIFATNRDLDATRTLGIAAEDAPDDLRDRARLVLLRSKRPDVPFRRQSSWSDRDGFSIERRTVRPNEAGRYRVELPPASVVRLELRAK